jgi:CelD/BcsL family acetyltransferase involved in cellulose biosynthesis
MLMLDDQPISIHYGFLHNRRYYAFMAARDPAYDACSPGKVHLEHVMAACFAHGAETVDLLAPEMPYKMVWATESAGTEDYGLTWSVRGWLAIDVWRRRVRPLSRTLFLALPDALRQRLARWLRA